MKGIIVTDLEGTLSDSAHRQHLIKPEMTQEDWHEWNIRLSNDRLNYRMVTILCHLQADYNIVLLSSKPGKYAEEVDRWLRKLPINFLAILLRADGDHRPSPEVKEDQLLVINPNRVYMAFDDRKDVCDMYRKYSIHTLQVTI